MNEIKLRPESIAAFSAGYIYTYIPAILYLGRHPTSMRQVSLSLVVEDDLLQRLFVVKLDPLHL